GEQRRRGAHAQGGGRTGCRLLRRTARRPRNAGESMTVRAYRGKAPRIGEDTFVAPSADVIGDVVIGPRSSIWYGTVLRGDVQGIRIGAETSIQDNSVVHVDSSGFSTVVGDRVTVGHGVVLHGCRIGDDALVGMGSIVLNGAEVGEGAMIGAGSLVTPGTRVPA